MKHGGRLVFDEVMDSTTTGTTQTSHTSLNHSDFLRRAEQIVLHAVVLCDSGGLEVNVTVEASANGKTWLNKRASGIPELSGTTIAGGVKNIFGGETNAASPNPRYVRLRIDYNTGSVRALGQVKVYAVARSRRKRIAESAAEGVEAATGGAAADTAAKGATAKAGHAEAGGLSPATRAEIHALFDQERPLGLGAHERVYARLSPGARGEVHRLALDVRALASKLAPLRSRES